MCRWDGHNKVRPRNIYRSGGHSTDQLHRTLIRTRIKGISSYCWNIILLITCACRATANQTHKYQKSKVLDCRIIGIYADRVGTAKADPIALPHSLTRMDKAANVQTKRKYIRVKSAKASKHTHTHTNAKTQAHNTCKRIQMQAYRLKRGHKNKIWKRKHLLSSGRPPTTSPSKRSQLEVPQ